MVIEFSIAYNVIQFLPTKTISLNLSLYFNLNITHPITRCKEKFNKLGIKQVTAAKLRLHSVLFSTSEQKLREISDKHDRE